LKAVDDRNVEDMNLTKQQDQSINPSLHTDNAGKLVLLIRSSKEAQLWFQALYQ